MTRTISFVQGGPVFYLLLQYSKIHGNWCSTNIYETSFRIFPTEQQKCIYYTNFFFKVFAKWDCLINILKCWPYTCTDSRMYQLLWILGDNVMFLE